MEEKKLQVTSGEEWRRPREKGISVELPSGNVARLRRVSLMTFIRQGKIPKPLAGLVHKMITGPKKQRVAKLLNNLDDVKAFATMVEAICTEAFVMPRIGEEPLSEGEISIDDVDSDDQMFVFNWTQGGEVKDLEDSRGEQAGDEDSGGIPPESQQDATPPA